MLITLRGFLNSDHVQPQTHNANKSQGMLKELRDRQTDRRRGGGGVGGSDMPKNKKQGWLHLFEFEWEGEGLGGVGAYSRLGTY